MAISPVPDYGDNPAFDSLADGVEQAESQGTLPAYDADKVKKGLGQGVMQVTPSAASDAWAKHPELDDGQMGENPSGHDLVDRAAQDEGFGRDLGRAFLWDKYQKAPGPLQAAAAYNGNDSNFKLSDDEIMGGHAVGDASTTPQKAQAYYGTIQKHLSGPGMSPNLASDIQSGLSEQPPVSGTTGEETAPRPSTTSIPMPNARRDSEGNVIPSSNKVPLYPDPLNAMAGAGGELGSDLRGDVDALGNTIQGLNAPPPSHVNANGVTVPGAAQPSPDDLDWATTRGQIANQVVKTGVPASMTAMGQPPTTTTQSGGGTGGSSGGAQTPPPQTASGASPETTDEDISYQALLKAGVPPADALARVQQNYQDPNYTGYSSQLTVSAQQEKDANTGIASVLADYDSKAKDVLDGGASREAVLQRNLKTREDQFEGNFRDMLNKLQAMQIDPNARFKSQVTFDPATGQWVAPQWTLGGVAHKALNQLALGLGTFGSSIAHAPNSTLAEIQGETENSIRAQLGNQAGQIAAINFMRENNLDFQDYIKLNHVLGMEQTKNALDALSAGASSATQVLGAQVHNAQIDQKLSQWKMELNAKRAMQTFEFNKWLQTYNQREEEIHKPGDELGDQATAQDNIDANLQKARKIAFGDLGPDEASAFTRYLGGATDDAAVKIGAPRFDTVAANLRPVLENIVRDQGLANGSKRPTPEDEVQKRVNGALSAKGTNGLFIHELNQAQEENARNRSGLALHHFAQVPNLGRVGSGKKIDFTPRKR